MKIIIVAVITLLMGGCCCSQLKQTILSHSDAISSDAKTIQLAIPVLKCPTDDDVCKGAKESLGSVAKGLDDAAKALKDAAKQ